MNWDAVSAIAELLGLAAVVISVLYLAAQIRQQTREVHIAAIHDVTQNFTDSLTPYLSLEVSDLWVRGTKDFDGLSEAERIQIISVFTINLRSFQDAFYQASDHRLDKDVWEGIINFYSAVLSTPGATRIWELRKHTFSVKFQAFVDGIDRKPYRTI